MPFPEPDPAKILSNERLRQALAVRDWLLGEARMIRDPNIILEGLALRLRDAGVPVERAISAIELRHAERAANARIWEWGFGHPAYGNVGSGARLDDTVIGRDVNLAARLASLCGQLDEPLLLSNAFQARLATAELRHLGAFKLKGLDGEQTVFAPQAAASAALAEAAA